MFKSTAKTICLILLALVIAAGTPLCSVADGETQMPAVISGSYSYTSNESETNVQGTDTFTFRERCFMASSYTGCVHLATLSAQVAISSAGRWGEDIDPELTDDPSSNPQNVIDMLQSMGFSDVETNKYYTLEKQENSAGVALGRRTLEADGKTYTLLAVVPRSANYKQEWVGNFTVGDAEYHDGFKQGRDEILRFVKQYLTANNVTGDLKIWIAGHSRGAALSNALGGFFAGGGAAFFDNVNITPDNVYCYTFATPKTVTESVSKAAWLSVSGPREDPAYAGDTEGEAYVCTDEGTLDPHDPVFNCIRNYPLPYDVITKLPPEAWGYTYFGTVETSDLNGAVTVEEMLEQLIVFAPFTYEEYVNGGDYRTFSMKTFDLANLAIVDDPSAPEGVSLAQFVESRVAGLVHLAPSIGDLPANGYDETLKAVAGLYGMLHSFKDVELDSAVGIMVEPLALAYIAYGRDLLKAEGRLPQEATDEEAACAVLCDLLSYFTGTEITGETLTDTAIRAILTYIVENEGSPLYNTAIATVSGMLPTEGFAASMVVALLRMFVADPDNATDEEMVGALLKACIYGPEEGTQAYEDGVAAETVCSLIYATLGMVDSDLGDAVGYGYSPTSGLTNYILKYLLVSEKDDDGKPIAYYSSLDEGADAKLATAAETVLRPLIEMHTGKYGDLFDAQLQGHMDTLLSGSNVTNLRKIVTYMLMYSEGESFGAKTAVGNAATLAGAASILPLAHYNEVNVAWCKAVENRLSAPAPETKRLNENGTAQPLVIPAEAKEGLTVLYALGSDGVTVPPEDAFSETVPTATESGVYYVWFKTVSGNITGEADCIEVRILEPEHVAPVPTGDSGIGVMVFCLAVSAVMLMTVRRKKAD